MIRFYATIASILLGSFFSHKGWEHVPGHHVNQRPHAQLEMGSSVSFTSS